MSDPEPARATVSPQERAGRKVVERLQQAGFQAYFAGGCVRDRLLGRGASDVDVATGARPEEVQALFRRTHAVGAHFGVVIVHLDREQIEVATFRADLEYRDGRRPEGVVFKGPVEDAARRDFTINGMFLDPLSEELHDFVGGRDDLRRGLVRAIGDPEVRFDEDKLRILRAPRFAAALGFRIDPDTAAAARRRAAELHQVSQERIQSELARMLLAPTRGRALALCRELGLIDVILPELAGKEEAALRALGALPAGVDAPLAWAALLHEVPPPAVRAALERLRCSNHDRDQATALVEALPAAVGLAGREVAEQKRLLRRPDAPALAELLRAAALAGQGDLEPLRFFHARREAYLADPSPAGLAAPPLLRGGDLGKAGVPPGPAYGRILRAVEDAQLEGRVRTAADALALALALSPA